MNQYHQIQCLVELLCLLNYINKIVIDNLIIKKNSLKYNWLEDSLFSKTLKNEKILYMIFL